MHVPQFLQSLPFWPHPHPSYFANGVADGKAAADATDVQLRADLAHISDLAMVASKSLPADIDPDDARVYRLGWIEGYRDAGKQQAPGGQ